MDQSKDYSDEKAHVFLLNKDRIPFKQVSIQVNKNVPIIRQAKEALVSNVLTSNWLKIFFQKLSHFNHLFSCHLALVDL